MTNILSFLAFIFGSCTEKNNYNRWEPKDLSFRYEKIDKRTIRVIVRDSNGKTTYRKLRIVPSKKRKK